MEVHRSWIERLVLALLVVMLNPDALGIDIDTIAAGDIATYAILALLLVGGALDRRRLLAFFDVVKAASNPGDSGANFDARLRKAGIDPERLRQILASCDVDNETSKKPKKKPAK